MSDPGAVALFLPDLGGGGAERVIVQLSRDLHERGHGVDLVLGRLSGAYVSEIPAGVRVVELGATRTLACLPLLARYLRRQRPQALLSTMNHVNAVAIAAARASRTGVRVVVREASNVTGQKRDALTLRGKLTPLAMRLSYRGADQVVAVSESAKADLVRHTGLGPETIEVIYNPIDFERVRRDGRAPVEHAFLTETHGGLVLAVGRLSQEKGFDVLIDAFAKLAGPGGPRLLICGEGDEREALQRRVQSHGVEPYVSMPGFVPNPFAYIARADVLVLPSRWEGLPNVLIHSLALGTPVVATDCPGGSSEILSSGEYGRLVPVEDAGALREAIEWTLGGSTSSPVDAAWEARFEAAHIVRRYEAVLGLGG